MLRSIASLPEAPECKSGVLFFCRLPGPLYKTSKQILNLRGFRKSRTESVMKANAPINVFKKGEQSALSG